MELFFCTGANLRLFDGAAPTGEGGSAAQSAAQTEATASPERGRRGKTGESAKVVYGKAETAGEQQDTETTLTEGSDAGSEAEEGAQKTLTEAERKAQFEALISGDYKDLFTQRTQSIIDRRFREVKEMEGQVTATRPILELLAQKYGVEGADPVALTKAIEADDSYWSEEAEANGMTVPQYREFRKLQRENESLREARRTEEGRAFADRQVEQWQTEAREMLTDYPEFDLAAEAKNPQFMGMLKSGIDVRHAYEVLHLGEIRTRVARESAQQAEKRVTENIRAKGARPAENGTASPVGVIFKSDPSALTRADRAEIAKRVARGETIQF